LRLWIFLVILDVHVSSFVKVLGKLRLLVEASGVKLAKNDFLSPVKRLQVEVTLAFL